MWRRRLLIENGAAQRAAWAQTGAAQRGRWLSTGTTAMAALALSLLYRTPACRLVLLAVDHTKRGRRPVMTKTDAGNMPHMLVSSGYSDAKFPRRTDELGHLTPADQVQLACTSSTPLSWVHMRFSLNAYLHRAEVKSNMLLTGNYCFYLPPFCTW